MTMRAYDDVIKEWEPVIGLEIHTELTTLQTKMFCGCELSFGDEPNTHTCPVCLGLPGALPVPNRAAIESIVLAGLATNCDIQKRSMFYRKGYFYPDMSKNFQITQGPVAFCMYGGIDLDVAGPGAAERIDVDRDAEGNYSTHVGILRIHMEEDAAKLLHIGGADGRIDGATHSLVDYNRCGTPLIELVTDPDMHSPEEARSFMQKIRQIFLTIGISDCSMEEGSMRADGNISLRRRGTTPLGTKAELKNINSFKALHDALIYEVCRQAEILDDGGTIVQETRHWEPGNKRTISMRVKETADDYRLFPDPDLAPYDLSDEFIEGVRSRLPELPDAKKARFVTQFGLPASDAAELAGDPALADFFEKAVDKASAKQIANIMLNDLAAYLNSSQTTIDQLRFEPAELSELAGLIADDTISSKQGKEVFALMLADGRSPKEIIEEKGMRQVSDATELIGIVDAVLAAAPDKVAGYRGGKTGLLGFFVGQIMRETHGQANPKLVNELLVERLEQ